MTAMTDPIVLQAHEWLPAGRAPDGAPIAVLVHGIGGWYRTWWRVGPALAARGWRVVAVDQLGHGRSPRIDGTVGVEDLAAAVGAVIDGMTAPVDLLLGHSLGAAVAIELVHRRRGIARRLALEDPPSVTRADDTEFQRHFESEVLAARADAEAEVRRVLSDNPRWLEEDARQDVEGRAMVDLEGIMASLRANTGVRVLELAAQLTVPTLFLLADEERSVVGAARQQLLDSLPAGVRALGFDSGHVVHRDRFDEYLAALLAWLDEPVSVAS